MTVHKLLPFVVFLPFCRSNYDLFRVDSSALTEYLVVEYKGFKKFLLWQYLDKISSLLRKLNEESPGNKEQYANPVKRKNLSIILVTNFFHTAWLK